MHFASIMAMMEEAEHEFLRHINVPLFRTVSEGKISWPRVSAHCDFKSPARFEDVLEIDVGVQRLGRRSVTYQFIMRIESRTVAVGTMTAACCLVAKSAISPVDIPGDIRDLLEDHQIESA